MTKPNPSNVRSARDEPPMSCFLCGNDEAPAIAFVHQPGEVVSKKPSEAKKVFVTLGGISPNPPPAVETLQCWTNR